MFSLPPMLFTNVAIASLAVELPDEVWSSAFVEKQLEPLYRRLHLPEGRLELMTGIRERRFWSRPIRPSEASALAGKKALAQAGIAAGEVDLLIHAAVCRDRLEPSTAAYVHGLLGANPAAQILDVSNACLGFLNAVTLAAGLIQCGNVRRALICSGENGRPLVEHTIKTLNAATHLDRNAIKPYFANLTIGAGACAAVLCHGDLAPAHAPRLLGGAVNTDSASNTLCEGDSDAAALVMQTDSEKLLGAGIALAEKTWAQFTKNLHWDAATPRRVLTHQVGKRHTRSLFERLRIDPAKDWPTFDTLGNVGSVSLPATLALAREAQAIAPGDKVALLGIGSGLSSLMLGVQF